MNGVELEAPRAPRWQRLVCGALAAAGATTWLALVTAFALGHYAPSLSTVLTLLTAIPLAIYAFATVALTGRLPRYMSGRSRT